MEICWIMWPLCVIVDKMLEIAAAGAGDERDDQPQQGGGGGGVATVSRRSCFIDVWYRWIWLLIYNFIQADCLMIDVWWPWRWGVFVAGAARAAALQLGLRPRLRVDGAGGDRRRGFRHSPPRWPLQHHKVRLFIYLLPKKNYQEEEDDI